MSYFTYIIESDKNQMWYYGHCGNVENRLDEHNRGLNKSTKNKGPWRLIFKREFETRLEANRFELQLKKQRNKLFIKTEYKHYFL